MASLLKKIHKRTEEIQRQYPSRSYQTAKNQAWNEYRQGKIGKVKKASKKPGKKKARYVPVKAEHCRRIGAVADQTLTQSLSLVRKKLKAELGWMLVNREQAVGVTNKRKYNAKIVELRRKLSALS